MTGLGDRTTQFSTSSVQYTRGQFSTRRQVVAEEGRREVLSDRRQVVAEEGSQKTVFSGVVGRIVAGGSSMEGRSVNAQYSVLFADDRS